MRVDWYPPGPVAESFMDAAGFVAGIMGPVGSGKSVTCAMKVLELSQNQTPSPLDKKRYTRGAIIRNTYPELKTTTIKTWHQWVPPDVGRWRDEGPPCHHIQVGDLDIEVLFIALDRPQDVRKLLSLELSWAWINEAREVPKAILDGLTGRVGRFPEAKHGGCRAPQIVMDTNPPDTDHWWYMLAEHDASTPKGEELQKSVMEAERELRAIGALAEGQALFEFFHQPGGLSPNAENTEGLGHMPGGRVGYYTRASAGKTSEWVNVYVNGNYGFVMDGKPVYPEYNDTLHCKPTDYNPRLPVFIGLDFGLTPAATLFHRSAVGRYLVFDELVTEDMGAVRFAELLRDKLAQYGIQQATITGDPAGDIRAQTDEITPFQILRANGVDARPAPTNDFIKRRESVAVPLSRLIDGQPGIQIDPRCRNLRKGMMGGYCYRRVQVTGSERFADMPDKGKLSHVAESFQYGILGAGEHRELVRRPSRGGHRSAYAVNDM